MKRIPLAIALVLAYVTAMTAFNVWKPRILVLQSFSESLRQVQETDAGLKEPLRANRLPLSVRWYYLNADQAASRVGGHAALMGLRRLINDDNPTVVIAVDDSANTLLAQEPELWRGRKLFFLGINSDPTHYGYKTGINVTGIRDRLPVVALEGLFAVIRPTGGLRLAVLGSDSDQGRDLGQSIGTQAWPNQRLVSNQRVTTWAQWQAAVQNANRRADILLISDVYGLRRTPGGPLVPPGEVVSWTEAQTKRLLPIGLLVDYVPLGGGLAVIPSARYLGTMTMESVLRWLEPSLRSGTPAIHLADHFDIGLREQALQRRGVVLPAIYREAARLSGQLIPTPIAGSATITRPAHQP